MKRLQYYTFLLIILGFVHTAFGQRNERIKYQAEEMNFQRNKGDSYRLLSGEVVFKQKETTVYCDTSYFYRSDNRMEAYGNVRIVDDSTIITSKKLIYEGDERMAKLRQKVVYVRGENRLYTDFLDYDLDGEIAHYFSKGKLIDSTNVLTSDIAYYFAKDEFAQFYTNVVLTSPDFVLETDTLRYNTATKIAYTYGKTIITTEDGTTLHANGGEFRTEVEETDFIDGNIETEDYYLEGDQLFFDEKEGYYKAIANVKMTAKDKDVIITGDEGFYDRGTGMSKVYGNTLMKRVLSADTFYLSADTLVAIESDYDSANRILAYHDVVLYKEGLQGKADSMSYFTNDSLIVFYEDPVMWNNQNQITSDTISIEISDEEMKRMNLLTKAFLISKDSIGNYNQIKGRDMITHFARNQIDRIDVNGNGEILYFALEEGDSVLMGMNKIFCASMQIRFKDQKLSSFSVYTKPEAKFIPPHELTKEMQFLDFFAWRDSERPTLYDLAPYLHPNPNYLDSLANLPADSLASPMDTLPDDNKPERKSVLGRKLTLPRSNSPTSGDGKTEKNQLGTKTRLKKDD